ncbi:protein phosphatase 1 regulatory subunit 15 [Arctopsyche grandis]|uniref:protein phosphatase 1 regulatory subunit 15 n=1 Tax=Arctopsyche grandis TaxID=121162 RepID=UPI00406D837B
MELKTPRRLYPSAINNPISRSYGTSTVMKETKPNVTVNNFSTPVFKQNNLMHILNSKSFPDAKMINVYNTPFKSSYDRSKSLPSAGVPIVSTPSHIGLQKNVHKQKYFNKKVDNLTPTVPILFSQPKIPVIQTILIYPSDLTTKAALDNIDTVRTVDPKIETANCIPDQTDRVDVDDMEKVNDLSKKPSRFLGKNWRKKDKGKGKKTKEAEEEKLDSIARCEDKLECLKKMLEKKKLALNDVVPDENVVNQDNANVQNINASDSSNTVILNSNSESLPKNVTGILKFRELKDIANVKSTPENVAVEIKTVDTSSINRSPSPTVQECSEIKPDSQINNLSTEDDTASTNKDNILVKNENVIEKANVATIVDNFVNNNKTDLSHTIEKVPNKQSDENKTDVSYPKSTEPDETLMCKVVSSCQDGVNRIKELLKKKKCILNVGFGSEESNAVGTSSAESARVRDVSLNGETDGKFSGESSGYETSDDDQTFHKTSKTPSKVDPGDESDGELPQHRISECDSEDSFIVFENDPNDGNDLDALKCDMRCVVETSDDDEDDDEEEGTLLKCEDSDADSDSDYCTSELNSVDETPTLKSCMKKPRSRQSSPKLPAQDLKEVSFSTAPPKVHKIIAWKHAYHMARIGHWQNYARDTERFKQRITNTSLSLDWVLKREHRNKVFFQRFRPIIMRQKREEQAAKAKERREAKEREIQAERELQEEKEREMLKIESDGMEDTDETEILDNKMALNESSPRPKADESILVITETLNCDNSNST